MKRLTNIALSVMLIIAVLAMPALAADGFGAVTAASGAPGDTVSVTVSLSGLGEADSIGLKYTLPSDLAFDADGSKWLLKGTLEDVTAKSAALALSEPADVNGDILTLSFTIKADAAKTGYEIPITLVAQNQGQELCSETLTAKVTVSFAATDLSLSKTQVTLDLSGTKTENLTATVTPANSTDTVSWTTSDASVVTVENGKLTAVKAGTATITATAGKISKTCAVTVTCSHDLTATPAQAATCQTEGTNGYYTCANCAKVFKDDKATTETTVEAEKLSKLAHVFAEEWTTSETEHWHKCKTCDQVSGKAAHDWKWVTDKAATEEAAGVKHEECVCGLKRNENTPIDKLTHTHKNITHHEAVAATCLTDGKKEYWTCGECGKLFSDADCTTEITEADLTVKAGGHSLTQVAEKKAGCEAAGTAAHYACEHCGKVFSDAEGKTETTLEALAIAPTGHSLTQVASKDATCEEAGNITYFSCSGCDKVFADKDASIETTLEKVTVEATGHSYDDGKVTAPPTETEPGTRAYTCSNCGHVKKEEIPALGKSDVVRISGSNRCETAFAAADKLKEVLELDSFDTIILASGSSYADALAGSYLAAVKQAPILLYRKGFEEQNRAYIAENLSTGGTVYILGGPAAVPETMDEILDGFNVERLQGDNRYLTNLEILEEAGIAGDRILVATGMGFADCLAASATGLPILMVNSRLDKLTAEQEAFLKENSGKTLTVIGGTAAVSENVMDQLKEYGTVERITGDIREHTAVNVAEKFFSEVDTVVLAYARNFPDALCGGPLAYALDCPLLLVNQKTTSYAADYLAAEDVTTGYVMGGTAVINDETVNAVFGG